MCSCSAVEHAAHLRLSHDLDLPHLSKLVNALAQAVEDFVTGLDKKFFRPLQKESYMCSARACDGARDQATLQQQCAAMHRPETPALIVVGPHGSCNSDGDNAIVKYSNMYVIWRMGVQVPRVPAACCGG